MPRSASTAAASGSCGERSGSVASQNEHALGYTGLGVGASRSGARVALDLLAGRSTDATRLWMVRRRPVPFPPEPLRSGVIAQPPRCRRPPRRSRRAVARALDRMALGFDS